MWNISTNISALGQRTQLKLGELSSLFIVYNITFFLLRPLHSFYFIFLLRDSRTHSIVSSNFFFHTFSGMQVSLPVQLYPSPANPGLQVQLNDPFVLLHKAPSLLQVWVSWTHSSISERELRTLDTDHSRSVP